MDWVYEYYVKKGHLFLEIMNSKWRIASEEADLISRVFRVHGISRGARVLEVGCGNGRIAINLANLGYNVTGLDISELYINNARRRAKEYEVDVEFIVGDAREIDRIIDDKYDAVLFFWSSVIGYYDEKTDLEILRKCHLVTKGNGKLFILNHANRDYIVYHISLRGKLESLLETDNYVVIEVSRLNVYNSRFISTLKFYRRDKEELIFVDELVTSQRGYSLHELVSLGRMANWYVEKAYGNLATLEEFARPHFHGSINVVFNKGG